MIVTIQDALTKIQAIASIAPFYQQFDEDDVIDALEETAGKVFTDIDNDGDKDGFKAYRPYAAAAVLIESMPDLWIIKEHDNTVMNSPKDLIAGLGKRQALQDQLYDIIPPETKDSGTSGGDQDAPIMGNVSYLPRVIG